MLYLYILLYLYICIYCFICCHILVIYCSVYILFWICCFFGGWDVTEVKGPIPRLCVNHRNIRIEWEHGLSRGVRLGMDYVTTSRVVVSNGGIIVTRLRAVMMLTFGRTVYCVS